MYWDSLLSVFSIESIIFMCFGVVMGIIFGALPGLTTVLAVVLFTPMTFGMKPVTAMMLLLGLYCGGTYGGSITAILINTPGTPAASATCIEGYPLAKKGMARKALDMALYASFVGGILSGFILLFAAPLIAKATMLFTAAEYFCLSMFGLSMVISVSNDDIPGGIISCCIGLFISTIGIDNFSGVYRFTFGNIRMASGVETLIMMIGTFAISELMFKAARIRKGQPDNAEEVKDESFAVRGSMPLTFKETLRSLRTMIRSSLIGVGIGAMPAIGGGVAAFLSYDAAKRLSKHKENFGKGELDGVAATEAGNNGVTGAALIPLFTLGIPGDGVTAVLLGALMIHGLVPGPLLFSKSADIVYTIMYGFIIINIIMLLLGKVFLPLFAKIANISDQLLIPLIMLFCGAGAYAVRNSPFDLILIVAFGALSFILQKMKIAVLPLVLGIVLGKLTETNFVRAMLISLGKTPIFFTRPICIAFNVLIVISISTALLAKYRKRKKAAKAAEESK